MAPQGKALRFRATGPHESSGNGVRYKRAAALAVPPVLILTMVATFRIAAGTWGNTGGYLAGFVLYWLAWCLALPFGLIGSLGVRAAFRATALGSHPSRVVALLAAPVAFPLFFKFLPGAASAGWKVLAASVLLGIITAITEELLWRGVYLNLFPKSLLFGVLYPSVWFALWHLAPLAILPNRLAGGSLSFVIYSFLLGAVYATASRMTGSIFWAVVAHAIHDALGLGGLAYRSWLA